MSESAPPSNSLSPCLISAPGVKSSLVIGSNLSSICYGIMVFLGCRCFNALRRQTGGRSPRVRIGLMCWVVVTIIVGTAVLAWDIAAVITAFLTGCKTFSLLEPPFFPGLYCTWLAMDIITDGLLVWRCYAITAGFQRRWLLAWLVPLTVSIGTIVLGIVVLSKSSFNLTPPLPSQVLVGIIVGASLFLNVIISSSIVLLLFHHKNMSTRADGGESGKPYLNLITILVESASLIILSDALSLAALMTRSTILFIPLQTWAQIQREVVLYLARHERTKLCLSAGLDIKRGWTLHASTPDQFRNEQVAVHGLGVKMGWDEVAQQAQVEPTYFNIFSFNENDSDFEYKQNPASPVRLPSPLSSISTNAADTSFAPNFTPALNFKSLAVSTAALRKIWSIVEGFSNRGSNYTLPQSSGQVGHASIPRSQIN
ncbi:hypothetical protein D9756_010248 [Leucocoprinus leucothites]|uniref:Uncharacterized protein n=1 Tax=Leucocoprinus leucothites TaxID=201217 RepID=A0A8H5CTE9_9AGAR|nr:hypothetical protein D9756_010248 [Leucoagaricus leucothites]